MANIFFKDVIANAKPIIQELNTNIDNFRKEKILSDKENTQPAQGVTEQLVTIDAEQRAALSALDDFKKVLSDLMQDALQGKLASAIIPSISPPPAAPGSKTGPSAGG